MEKKEIVLITRTWCGEKSDSDKKKYDKDIKNFIKEIHEEFNKIVVLINVEKETNNHTRNLLKKFNKEIAKKLEIIDVKPWGIASGALNIGLNKVFTEGKKPGQILIASKEVDINKNHIQKMSKYLKKSNMLVVGLALKAKLDGLLELEEGHSYDFYISDALRVPWNTCAMWDADLFYKNVKSFLNICDYPDILGVKNNIKLQGMEDALAIALTIRNNPKLKVGLIHEDNNRNWDVKNKRDHIEKMRRKSLVYEKYEEIFGKFDKINVIKL